LGFVAIVLTLLRSSIPFLCVMNAVTANRRHARTLSPVGQDEARSRPPLIERVRARQQRHRQRNRLFRVAFAIGGFLVLLAGVIMLFTPGPGLAAIVLGLTMLALEFTWAERALERMIDRAEQAADQVTKGSPVRRAALLTLGFLTLAASIAVIFIWDIPFFPG
jgi:uncharacterized protein (TIGR02611 family)